MRFMHLERPAGKVSEQMSGKYDHYNTDPDESGFMEGNSLEGNFCASLVRYLYDNVSIGFHTHFTMCFLHD